MGILKKIFIDESGYTGYDLLNIQQPFQGASSLLIDENDAKKLIDEYFPKIKSNELKHRDLSRRKNNWKSLLDIQKVVLDEYMGFTYICDKKYLLTLMFLDSCVEPFFYDQNIDFYQDGQNYALASLIYYTAPTFWGANNYEEILYLFQKAEKSKSDIAIQALIEKAKLLMGKELSENLMPLSMEYDNCIREIKNSHFNTDAAFVVLFSLISHIEKHMTNKYEIVHDTSNNLLRYNNLINWFITLDTDKKFIHTKITSMKFPFKLSAVSQQDSCQSCGVQLADVLIGGMVEHCKAEAGLVEKNKYNQSVMELYGDLNILHLFPEIDIEESKHFRSGNQASEFIEFISKNHS